MFAQPSKQFQPHEMDIHAVLFLGDYGDLIRVGLYHVVSLHLDSHGIHCARSMEQLLQAGLPSSRLGGFGGMEQQCMDSFSLSALAG